MVKDLALYDWLLDRSLLSPMNSHESHSLEGIVKDAVEALPPYERYLIEAKFYERLSYRELAERIGKKSKGAAYYAMKAALRMLRQELIDRGAGYDDYYQR